MSIKKLEPIDPERDVLRARFTMWMDTTLSRESARLRAKSKDKLEEDRDILSMESFSADYFPDPRDHFAEIGFSGREFVFEVEQLEQAFWELPEMRREVLRLMFVEKLTSTEVAEILHCSDAFVRVQKARAISKLREQLSEGSAGKHEE